MGAGDWPAGLVTQDLTQSRHFKDQRRRPVGRKAVKLDIQAHLHPGVPARPGRSEAEPVFADGSGASCRFEWSFEGFAELRRAEAADQPAGGEVEVDPHLDIAVAAVLDLKIPADAAVPVLRSLRLPNNDLDGRRGLRREGICRREAETVQKESSHVRLDESHPGSIAAVIMYHCVDQPPAQAGRAVDRIH